MQIHRVNIFDSVFFPVVKSKEERIRMYKAVFDCFPAVIYKTARRLFGHLHFIGTQSEKNRMNIDNLSSLWGPTLMQIEDKDEQGNMDPQKSTMVISQIISLYKSIFVEDPAEIEQERLMLQVLQKCMRSPNGVVNNKVSGDFRVWVYLFNKEGETFNVAVSGTSLTLLLFNIKLFGFRLDLKRLLMRCVWS